MSNEIEIPKEPTFKLPEGRYRARIQSFRTKPVETARGSGRNATILFEVQVPGKERFECLARRVVPYDLHKGSELRRLLAGLLTENFFVERSSQKIDLERELVGRFCDVELVHAKFDCDRYKFPLVVVERLYPMTPLPPEGDEEGCES